MIPKIVSPNGKDFAFTIFDDPDFDTVETTAAMYSFLADLGMRTTKAVWPLQGNGTPRVGGITCENERYLELVLDLNRDGFEIAFHNATYHTSTREQTAQGLETFRRVFGHDPTSMANHVGCHEGIYWGSTRLSGMRRLIYNMLNLSLSGNGTCLRAISKVVRSSGVISTGKRSSTSGILCLETSTRSKPVL